MDGWTLSIDDAMCKFQKSNNMLLILHYGAKFDAHIIHELISTSNNV